VIVLSTIDELIELEEEMQGVMMHLEGLAGADEQEREQLAQARGLTDAVLERMKELIERK
jgi:hypothetical protein